MPYTPERTPIEEDRALFGAMPPTLSHQQRSDVLDAEYIALDTVYGRILEQQAHLESRQTAGHVSQTEARILREQSSKDTEVLALWAAEHEERCDEFNAQLEREDRKNDSERPPVFTATEARPSHWRRDPVPISRRMPVAQTPPRRREAQYPVRVRNPSPPRFRTVHRIPAPSQSPSSPPPTRGTSPTPHPHTPLPLHYPFGTYELRAQVASFMRQVQRFTRARIIPLPTARRYCAILRQRNRDIPGMDTWEQQRLAQETEAREQEWRLSLERRGLMYRRPCESQISRSPVEEWKAQHLDVRWANIEDGEFSMGDAEREEIREDFRAMMRVPIAPYVSEHPDDTRGEVNSDGMRIREDDLNGLRAHNRKFRYWLWQIECDFRKILEDSAKTSGFEW